MNKDFLPSALCAFLLTLLLAGAAIFSPTPARAEAPRFLLANSYRADLNLAHYVVSEKLDGVRAQWDGRQLLSRNGNAFAAPLWFVAGYPPVRLDGELWGGRGSFEQTSGIVRRAKPHEGWRNIRFMVFDAPAAEGDFTSRLRHLRALVESADNEHLQWLAHRPIENRAGLLQQLEQTVAAGGEGLMLRRRDALYRSGRSDDLIKLKLFEDDEAVVIMHHAGKGKYAAMMGSITVERADGTRFKIGTGFSDRERSAPPPPGATVTYRFQGLTNSGLPRFPVFHRIRDDVPPAGE